MSTLLMAPAATTKPRQFQADDGVILRADTWGTEGNPAVILLHGGAQTRHSWKRTARRLADLGFYAVALDLRGHGESDWSRQAPYTLDRYVADLNGVAAAVGKKPVLIGASLGGLISILYAGANGKQAASAVVLVDIAARAENAGVSRIHEFLLAHQEGFASLEAAGDAVAEYLKHRKRPTALKGLEKNLRKGDDGRFYWHWDPAFIDSPLIEEVRDEQRLLAAAKKITVPLLLVRGANSDIVSPEIIEHFRQEVPHAAYIEVGGAGHTLAGDSNDEFTDAVVGFLQKLKKD